MSSDSPRYQVHPAIAGAVSEVRRLEGTLQGTDEPSRLIDVLEKGAPDCEPTRQVSHSGTGDWTLNSVAEAIRQRRLSPTEATEESLRRIEQSGLHAFIYVDRDGALKTAKQRDLELVRGQTPGPLHGAPLAHKDLFYIDGMPTSCGTAVPNYFVAEQTATAVARLEAAGAITIGKLNMTELAMSPFGDNPRHGDVENPWSRGGICVGGSSSGSAAAVAAGLVLGALGSDTAGSIRMPAAYCGIVGLKPTYGRVSRAGAMPLSWSLDHVGPMAKTVRDVALMLGVIAGYDRADRTTSAMPVASYVAALDQPMPRIRLAIPTNYYWGALDADLESAVRAAAEALVRLGLESIDLELPHQDAINGISSLITRSEGTAIHGAFAKRNPEILSPAINGRLDVGYHVSAFDYLQAQRLRARLARDFIKQVFDRVDMIIAPVVPGTAPHLADIKSGDTDAILAEMVRLTSLTRPANGLGLPAINVPCGFSKAGLPFAFQLIGRPFDEGSLLQVANRYEQSFEWCRRTPI